MAELENGKAVLFIKKVGGMLIAGSALTAAGFSAGSSGLGTIGFWFDGRCWIACAMANFTPYRGATADRSCRRRPNTGFWFFLVVSLSGVWRGAT